MEYTDGRIHLFDRHQNALVVEYIPNEAADAPPLDVRDWALILADDTGAVLASGVITQVRTDVGNIRRYQITPDQEGPAPPGHP